MTLNILFLFGCLSLALAAYPGHFEAGYGFVNHGGIGPHGHYLPGVAKVKIHKDPFHSTYSVDEEGPTHYKYVRQSSASHPILHHGIHHHGVIGAVGVPAVAGIRGGVIGGIGGAGYAGIGAGYGGYYGGLGVGYGHHHAQGHHLHGHGHGHGAFY